MVDVGQGYCAVRDGAHQKATSAHSQRALGRASAANLRRINPIKPRPHGYLLTEPDVRAHCQGVAVDDLDHSRRDWTWQDLLRLRCKCKQRDESEVNNVVSHDWAATWRMREHKNVILLCAGSMFLFGGLVT